MVRALASHQCGPGSNPGVDTICGLSLLLVLLLCSKRFISGYSGFPISPKTNISKFQFDQESGRRRTTLFRDVLPPNHFIHLFIFVLFSLKSIAGAHAHCCQGERGNFLGELESFRNYKGLSIIFPIILDAI